MAGAFEEYVKLGDVGRNGEIFEVGDVGRKHANMIGGSAGEGVHISLAFFLP